MKDSADGMPVAAAFTGYQKFIIAILAFLQFTIVLDFMIISPLGAIVMPVQRITAACHAAGVPVLIDGAHAPGQIDLDLTAIGADWYVGNCHKWLCAPKGCAFLYATPSAQGDLHPGTISHFYGQGFVAEFDWTGTTDPSRFLAVEEAIALARDNGVAWVGVRRGNHAGAAAVYAAMPVPHDMIGLYFAVGNANHLPPWGGIDMLLSTNPIAIGVPAQEEQAEAEIPVEKMKRYISYCKQ